LNKTATSTSADLGTAYREWAPHPALSKHVVCVWRDPARPRAQPVLPDACIDLVWDGTVLFVAGPDTHAVPIAGAASYVGVRFRPAAAPGFLGIPSDALVDARVDLAELWGRAAQELRELLLEHPAQAAPHLERALRQRQAAAAEPDRVVTALVRELTARPAVPQAENDDFEDEDGTSIGLEAASAALGVSPRTLRRRCTTALGYGPKTLERILRFRRALRLLRQRRSLADAARLAGYADQAHLTNEAQRLASATPAVLAATPNLSISTNGCD
jgi:AraC-like DNA-binding protein